MKLLAKITAALTLAAALTLTACAPGGETGTTNPPSSVFASKTALPAGDPNCANGGVQIDMGFDVNGNNVLDPGEIKSTEYVCNGQDASSHPFVVYTSPTPNETGVELDAVISAVFNIEMDADTINDTTFTVKDAAGTAVAGTVTYNGIVAVFQPAQSLVMNTKYTVTLSSVMENDAAGIAMGYDHKVYFTTGDRATVKYMANGADSGTVPVDTGRYATDAIVTVQGNTGNLVRDGYQFVGWSLKQDGSGTKYNLSNRLTAGTVNIILYAVWAMPYHVTYNANGGTGSVPVDPAEYTYNQEVTVLGKGDLTNGSLVFAGWNTQSDGNGTTYAPGSKFDKGIANVILYAKWVYLWAIETGFDIAVNTGDTATISVRSDHANMKFAKNSDEIVRLPMGLGDESTGIIMSKFFMAETEVTNALFAQVLQWAVDNRKIVKTSGTHNEVNAATVRYGGQELIDLDFDLNFGSAYMKISYNASTNTFAVAPGYEDHPVVCVSWYGTIMFCNWLTEMRDGNTNNVVYTGIDETWVHTETVENPDRTGYRLPSSAEWEYAARYCDGSLWTYGDHASGDDSGACFSSGFILGELGMSEVFGNYAWYSGNSDGSTHVVGTAGNAGGAACSGNANALGLYDMSGNVWEWCFTAEEGARLGGGGSWYDSAGYLRIGYREYYFPNNMYNLLGFRFARSAP